MYKTWLNAYMSKQYMFGLVRNIKDVKKASGVK